MPKKKKSPMDALDALEFVQQAVKRTPRQEELSAALWRMTAQERIAAMRAGDLTLNQLCEWARRRPHEVPLINNEFEFIAFKTPEVAEAGERKRRGRP